MPNVKQFQRLAPDDAAKPSVSDDTGGTEPSARRAEPTEDRRASRPVVVSARPQTATSRRRWLRPVLFAVLPLVLVAGGYEYVTGGRIMSTDDAYVDTEKVGISTDVSGIVKEV